MKKLVKACILGIANRSAVVAQTAAYITRNVQATHLGAVDTYPYLRQRFIENGLHQGIDSCARATLVESFERIDSDVPMASTPTDGLFLAELLLNVRSEGAIVECGCYAGGSSAKLSLVARLLRRELVVCDSFAGLPMAEEYSLRDEHCRRSHQWVMEWTKGRYAATLDQVKANIAHYGDLSVCRFVPGWFKETLSRDRLPDNVALAFVDVDLADSARDCFTALWPLVSHEGVYVTHDAAYIKVLQALYEPSLWRDHFRTLPPILFGAGFGLCDGSPHLGYMVKGDALSPAYLKSLTLDK